jgi:hypothetical protein
MHDSTASAPLFAYLNRPTHGQATLDVQRPQWVPAPLRASARVQAIFTWGRRSSGELDRTGERTEPRWIPPSTEPWRQALVSAIRNGGSASRWM